LYSERLTNLIVWQEPDPGTNALHAAFTHLKAVEPDPACLYAISRISDAPSASTRIVKCSPVVVIGVDRRSVGRDNGVRRPAAEHNPEG
jgi:hypothetical protein